MLSREDNERLTRTNQGTPMGEYFRRFWQPVALTEELPKNDGTPLRITVMGEELVAFRDTEGRVGLIDSRCPHRGAHMFYGRNEECGLRCVYHGWKFDVTGKAVDLPNIPGGIENRDNIRIKAYPTREYGGMVWAYLGPAAADLPSGKLPEIPSLEFGQVGLEHRYVMKQLMECNWAQIMEGDLDTSHFSFLHMPAPSVASNENPDAPADARRLRWIRNDPIPKFQIFEHEVGFVVGGARIADDNESYWRITQYMMPAHGTGPSTFPGETYFGFTLVPISDTSCWIYTYAWNPERQISADEREKMKAGHGIMAEVDENYVPRRNPHNDFQIDREVQRNTTYSGVKGLAEQDSMIQHSQGAIVDRTREILTTTDAAVVRFRRTVLEGAAGLSKGEEPRAPYLHTEFRTRPGSWIASEGTSFEDVMMQRFNDRLGRVQT
ncbi:MAG TPA: Rieske 2Fe-2S domain-containing protein [Hyphomicrobiaceae bacterium]|nr:Rieske 2Fe-2S domain-containing protein [Hyphomicrobiaceae bacterium]